MNRKEKNASSQNAYTAEKNRAEQQKNGRTFFNFLANDIGILECTIALHLVFFQLH